MVAREALYNSIRHAQPRKVELASALQEIKCRVGVRDDGSGFDPAMVSRLPEHHYGLIGIKERVERIGGRFILKSQPGAGTDLTLRSRAAAGAGFKPRSRDRTLTQAL